MLAFVVLPALDHGQGSEIPEAESWHCAAAGKREPCFETQHVRDPGCVPGIAASRAPQVSTVLSRNRQKAVGATQLGSRLLRPPGTARACREDREDSPERFASTQKFCDARQSQWQ